MDRSARLGALALGLVLAAPALGQAGQAPAAFDVADRTAVLTVHAEGVQLYQCKPDAAGHLAWSFREPIATLIGDDGKTIGRHFAGPSWVLDDGGAVKGKLLASAPGAAPGDIPLLKLAVAEQHGAGALAGVSLILRLDTRGGVFSGSCTTAGELHAEPYSADYVFLR
jgi:hypothetical protein